MNWDLRRALEHQTPASLQRRLDEYRAQGIPIGEEFGEWHARLPDGALSSPLLEDLLAELDRLDQANAPDSG